MNKRLAFVIELNGDMESSAREAWRVLDKELNIHYIANSTPCPHLTLAAEFTGDINAIAQMAQNLCQRVIPFTIDSAGLGIFIAQSPVLYVRWTLTEELIQLQKMISTELTMATQAGIVDGYNANLNWIAKSTLAFQDTTYEDLPRMLELVRHFNFTQHMQITEISLYRYGDYLEENISKFAFSSN